ncbi:MAG: cohesin domain-containing protein, partial [bacterium]
NITSHHPIFDLVTTLRADNGQSIIDLDTDSKAQIVQFEENQGVYAVFDPLLEPLVFLPRVHGLPGDTINVTLHADPIGGISGGDVVIGFDPEVLAATSVATTDFTKHFLVAANLDTPGLARISLAGAEGAVGDLGGVVTLRMIVNPSLSIPDTAFSRPLKLQIASFYDQNGQLLPATKRDGEFVLGKSRGDVNGDGFVNAADAILTLRIAAGLLDPTPEQFAAADVDANGHVESFDASCILRRAVGLPCPPGGNSGVAAMIAVSPFSANAGNLVETTISVDGIEKLLSGDMTLRFAPAALEITEIRPSSGMAGVAFISNLSAGGQARISFAATEAIPAKAIAVVRLRAKASVNERDLRSIEGIFFDSQGWRWNSIVTGVHSPEESTLPSTFHL